MLRVLKVELRGFVRGLDVGVERKRGQEENILLCPDWCGSAGWALFHRPKARQFDSQSGRAHAWVAGHVSGWGCERGHRLVSFPLSPSLPLSLNK